MTGTGSDQRTYERFDKKAKAFLYYNYEFTTKLDFAEEIPGDEVPATHKYPACSKNVSAEGLCFTSLKKLKEGEKVCLDMYLGEKDLPLHLEGEVRWSQVSAPSVDEDEGALFDTGVRLTSVEGRPVSETICFDDHFHVIWSDVLETILGKVKDMAKEKDTAAA